MLDDIRKLIGRVLSRDLIERKTSLRFGRDSESYRLIMLACDTVRDEHRGKKRKNGEALITHERAMYVIALEYLNIRDVEILVAIFLHDLVEDYRDWTYRRVENQFGPNIKALVKAVTKPRRRKYQSDEAYDKAIFTRVNRGGPKARTLKCIDRMHNMITLWGSAHKKAWKIRQTLQYVLPMAIQMDVLWRELMLATVEQAQRLGINHRELRAGGSG